MTIPLSTVGILFNPSVKAAPLLAETIEKWLVSRITEIFVASVDDPPEILSGAADVDVLVVLGGDGTILKAARLAAPLKVPVFGVNLGRVGFLSEATPRAWQEKLSQVIDGNYWIERRLMLKGSVLRDGSEIANMIGLNDVVVSRASMVRVVRFHLFVDDDLVISYTADGLITATPTGSTAYSMAAGGPLLPPQLQNFLVLPVAPHLSFDRPLVLYQDAVVKIKVEMEHQAIATADGQNTVSLISGDEVIIKKHKCESLFTRVDGPNYFYHRLMQRLSYWSRKAKVIE
ncbi:MAG: NAD(+)/NADH kinase [Anaerolineae bacterium]|nr:MAG: NAD(+)/NADH kinase [Anaerolineae bacterium]